MTDTPVVPERDAVWERLRRRKVVQWGLAYAAGAWVLLQVNGSSRPSDSTRFRPSSSAILAKR